MIYKLVDTTVSVSLPQQLEADWKPFRWPAAEAELRAEYIPYVEPCYGVEPLAIQEMAHCLRLGNSILTAGADWSCSRLYAQEPGAAATLLELQLYSYLLPRRTLLFHSSLVNWQGRGILFLGPSGMGKTTQAELWQQYQGAEILNGDLTFVRRQPDGFWAYGSPWHGSSPYSEPERAAISALVLLEQGPENRLTTLEPFRALQGLMHQVYLPHWDRSTMDACLSTLDRLLLEVPVWQLRCRPDQASTQLVRDRLLETENNEE